MKKRTFEERRRTRCQLLVVPGLGLTDQCIRSLIVSWVAPRLAAEFAALEQSSSHPCAQKEEQIAA